VRGRKKERRRKWEKEGDLLLTPTFQLSSSTEYVEWTKMSAEALSVVVTPNILPLCLDIVIATKLPKVVELLIKNYEAVFEKEEEEEEGEQDTSLVLSKVRRGERREQRMKEREREERIKEGGGRMEGRREEGGFIETGAALLQPTSSHQIFFLSFYFLFLSKDFYFLRCPCSLQLGQRWNCNVPRNLVQTGSGHRGPLGFR
jgi:hypothetical protein